MPDGALDARGRGVELARDLGIEHLGHGVDDVHVVDGQQNRLAQVLVALDVRGHADLVDDVGDDALERGLRLRRSELRTRAAGALARPGRLADALHEQRRVKRLLHEVRRAELRTLHQHLFVADRGGDDHAGRCVFRPQMRQQGQAVQIRQHEVEHHDVGLEFGDEFFRAQPIVRLGDQFHVRLLADGLGIGRAVLFAGISQQNTDFRFHNILLRKNSGLRSALCQIARFPCLARIFYHIWNARTM